MALLRRPSSQVSASPPSSLSNLAELNVTPLLDLAFVLLIIFMITAPFLSGTSSQAPSPIIPNTGEVLEPSRVYTLEVTRSRKLIYEGEVISTAELKQSLTSILAENPDASLLIEADGKLSVDELVSVIRVAKDAGIVHIGIDSQTRL